MTDKYQAARIVLSEMASEAKDAAVIATDPENIRAIVALVSAQDERIEKLELERDALKNELAETKHSLIAFAAPSAEQYAKQHGLPDNHLYPVHYDILAKAGACLDGFIRAPEGDA